MPPERAQHLRAAEPSRKLFDPWNSSTTGHQRADNRLAGSTGWRLSRTAKLASQFRGGPSGGKRVADTVGAGSKDFEKDGRKENGGWEKGASGLRPGGQLSVGQMISSTSSSTNILKGESATTTKQISPTEQGKDISLDTPARVPEKKIFSNLCIYINGSTAPAISDHRLKYLLAEHGARVSIMLGRRSVTHVILGAPSGGAGTTGAGGGLAASKIHKEIKRIGGCGVKYVGVDWVLESVKAGKRLPEAQFSNMKLAAKGQQSVYGMFKRVDPGAGDAQ